ncbi:MAG: aminotransferase class I/II-fold pyridoxal phosphate-dependent enzyme [Candidatus Diapherotrites archaeon]
MKYVASKRSASVQYPIRDIVLEARRVAEQGKRIYYLNIGDPLAYDFRTPKHLWDAVEAHKREGECYGPSEGILEAREAIAAEYKKNGVEVVSNNVMLGNGLSELIWFAMGAIADPGESVLLPRPTYPLYVSACDYLYIKPIFYDLDEENNWEPDIEGMKKAITKKTKAISIVNPNNPCGSNYSRKTLEEIADIASEYNLVILSDEIYDKQLLNDKKHTPMGSVARDLPVLSMNGLSKNFFATGFRVGWIAANNYLAENSDIMEAIFRLGRARLCAVHPFQFAVKAALEGPMDFLEENLRKIRERQKFSHKRLNEIEGISCVEPEASFYAFPRIELKIKSDRDFVIDLLRETGVCVVFGEGFGQKKGTHHFRIVALPSVEILGTAFDLLEGFIKKNYC